MNKEQIRQALKSRIDFIQSDNLFLQLIHCTGGAKDFIRACITLSGGNFYSFLAFTDQQIADCLGCHRSTIARKRKQFLAWQENFGRGVIAVTEGIVDLQGHYTTTKYRVDILLAFYAFEIALRENGRFNLPPRVTPDNRKELETIALPIIDGMPAIHYLKRKGGTEKHGRRTEHPRDRARRVALKKVQALIDWKPAKEEDKRRIENEFVEFLLDNDL